MTIDWAAFTPGSALLGGAMIGLAAAILIIAVGRVMGASSILAGVLGGGNEGETAWRVTFLVGLMLAPTLLLALSMPVPAPRIETPVWLLAIGGLLVGFGTRLGSGCTSGHGICGLARLSPRSLVATLCFMATGMLTVFVVRHVIA